MNQNYFINHLELEKKGMEKDLMMFCIYKDGKTMTAVKNELILSLPDIFKSSPDYIPDYSKVSKEQLRLFRNLIFARHGYNFKSADLKEYFSSCSWYKVNHNFSEDDFTEDEKAFIELMQKWEKR